jgi:hydroxymethylpyrimidine/phosphomethylpyrimidine kinase
MIPVALTIAGSDPSGGAGIQADLKTFHAHGVFGQAAIALLTVQNSQGVQSITPVEAPVIAAQIAALWSDIPPQAAKTGALPSGAAVRAIAEAFRGRDCPLVIDPVLAPTRGDSFADADLIEHLRHDLLPLSTLITPNIPEARALTGIDVHDVASAMRAAEALIARGAHGVLIKGGHLPGDPLDVLLVADGTEMVLASPRLRTQHTHGTGCTYSAAITAELALGRDLPSAVRRAKVWLTRVLESPLGLGRGRGPLNHFVAVREP